jgi:hypothetical protein
LNVECQYTIRYSLYCCLFFRTLVCGTKRYLQRREDEGLSKRLQLRIEQYVNAALVLNGGFFHSVVVQARVDAPVVVTNNLTVVENLEEGVNSMPLFINVNVSVDSERDDSEWVSVL